jgi:hypothetical protein
MNHRLRDIRQNFAIGRLLASTVRRAEEDNSKYNIADRSISWFKVRL